MRMLGQFIAFLALGVFLLPALTAQEEKKDADAKAEKKEAKEGEKKDPEKKEPEKKDEKKDPEKKEPEKKAEVKKKVVEEKVEYGSTMVTKIASMKESARDFSIEVKQYNPSKLTPQDIYQMTTNPGQRQQIMMRAFETKIVDLRAADNVKVRTMNPPFEYDDKGNVKRWTAKDLAALKGKSKLPGYPSEIDQLKVGQSVQLFFAKAPPVTKGSVASAAKQKKKINEDDPEPAPMGPTAGWQEVVMIVILQDPPPRPYCPQPLAALR